MYYYFYFSDDKENEIKFWKHFDEFSYLKIFNEMKRIQNNNKLISVPEEIFEVDVYEVFIFENDILKIYQKNNKIICKVFEIENDKNDMYQIDHGYYDDFDDDYIEGQDKNEYLQNKFDFNIKLSEIYEPSKNEIVNLFS